MSEQPLWLPSRYTKPLSEDFTTDGERLLRVVDKYWSSPDSPSKFALDEWQRWVIRHALETYPPGHPKAGQLRYRQIVLSMGRQNGKSVLGGIFGFYGLSMHEYGPEVVGIASNREQADIIYERVLHVINESPALTKKFKTSGTRGIKHRNGVGKYVTKPAKADAVQGFPISLCLFDELHVSKADMWQTAVNAQRTKRNGLIIGFTTAGDDNSELLKDLYVLGEKAMADEDSRFGFFCWEAPNDEPSDANIMAANPSVACGRIDLDTVRSDVNTMPDAAVQRFVLNRFIKGAQGWLEASEWSQSAHGGLPADLDGAELIWSVDTTALDAFVSITVTAKVGDTYYTELVAAWADPVPEHTLEVCERLFNEHSGTFVMEGFRMRELAKALQARGYKAYSLNVTEMSNATKRAFALIRQDKVSHPDDDTLRMQLPGVRLKFNGDDPCLDRRKSAGDIDAVVGMTMGLYLAERINNHE